MPPIEEQHKPGQKAAHAEEPLTAEEDRQPLRMGDEKKGDAWQRTGPDCSANGVVGRESTPGQPYGAGRKGRKAAQGGEIQRANDAVVAAWQSKCRSRRSSKRKCGSAVKRPPSGSPRCDGAG
jgi:hypothetical protein